MMSSPTTRAPPYLLAPSPFEARIERMGVLMKRLLSLTVAALLMSALSGMTSASAATARASFDWHAGDNFGGFLESPDVAMAANGDSIAIMAGRSEERRVGKECRS